MVINYPHLSPDPSVDGVPLSLKPFHDSLRLTKPVVEQVNHQPVGSGLNRRRRKVKKYNKMARLNYIILFKS